MTGTLRAVDPLVADLLAQEDRRLENSLNLLAPSMSTSSWLREINGSRLADLDGEGYLPRSYQHALPFDDYVRTRSARKYNLCGPRAEYLEILAERRLAHCFSRGTDVDARDVYVNVQPVSGSSANIAVLRGLVAPGARVLGLGTTSGGHLSHGASAHLSGSDYQVNHLSLERDAAEFDTDTLVELAAHTSPDVVILGASSYPRFIHWERVVGRLREQCPDVVVVADIAHFAGLVVTGHYPNPLPYVDVVTAVGYKTLAGPKCGFILCRDGDLDRRVRRALFPGLQSSPRVTDVAGLATAALVVAGDDFRELVGAAVDLASRLVHELSLRGLDIAFGGTDTHMVLVDAGQDAPVVAEELLRIGVLLNPNILPGDSTSRPTGLRIGTVGACQRGLRDGAVPAIAELIDVAVRSARGESPTYSAETLLAQLLEGSARR